MWTVEFGEEVSEVQEGRRERAGYGGDSVGGREEQMEEDDDVTTPISNPKSPPVIWRSRYNSDGLWRQLVMVKYGGARDGRDIQGTASLF